MMKKWIKLLDYVPIISNKTKLTISGLLFLFSFVLCFIYPEALDRKLCLFAMFLSFLGDASLNCVLIEERPNSLMYLGATFFMFAHLAYAFAYYSLINTSYKYFNIGTILAFLLIIILLSVAIICMIIFKQSVEVLMLSVFGIYVIIISINFITIFSYSWSVKSLSFVGAVSFLISDFIIGVENIFKIKSDILRKLVWIFYPIGQFIILSCR